MSKRQIHDADGTAWEASEGYMWNPMRYSAPGRFIVFRSERGVEVRAKGTPELASLADAELGSLLARSRRAAVAGGVMELLPIRLAPGFHLPLYAPQMAAAS